MAVSFQLKLIRKSFPSGENCQQLETIMCGGSNEKAMPGKALVFILFCSRKLKR